MEPTCKDSFCNTFVFHLLVSVALFFLFVGFFVVFVLSTLVRAAGYFILVNIFMSFTNLEEGKLGVID